MEIFKTKASARIEGEESSTNVGGADKGLLGMRRLEIVERLMRTRGATEIMKASNSK
jgi:hypothetical protein